MSSFKKYPEIENTYRQKFINEHLEYHPQCAEVDYVYQIKLDGSNISFWFYPDGIFKIAKRSSFIGDDDFQGIHDVLPRYQEIIDYGKQKSKELDDVLVFYGEFFGQGIQNRIRYHDGVNKYITFFDVRIGDKMLVYDEILDEMDGVFFDYFITTYCMYSLEESLDVPVPEGQEGIVIKPYNRIDFERLLILKKKNPEFEEKMKPKKKVELKPEDPVVTELKEKFLEYINENRVLSVFSKTGEIDRPEQIGQYIRLVMEDTIEDFQKDVDISGVDRNKLKQVYKSGNQEIVKILKKYL